MILLPASRESSSHLRSILRLIRIAGKTSPSLIRSIMPYQLILKSTSASTAQSLIFPLILSQPFLVCGLVQVRSFSAILILLLCTNESLLLTDDLGPGDFITDSNVPETSLADFSDCHIEWMKRLYEIGARNFAIMSLAPLFHTPQYATAEDDGVSVLIALKSLVN